MKIFHGGCVGCISQNRHGIEYCRGCQYYSCDWESPDLSEYMEDIGKSYEYLCNELNILN